MGNPIASLLIALLLLVSSLCFGQTRMVISHPVVEVEEGSVHIFYNTINSNPNYKYNVTLLITDTWGDELTVKALSGDVGEKISGGVRKHIVWDAKADQIALDGHLDVKILLEAVSSANPGISSDEPDLNGLGEADPMAGEDAISKSELIGTAGSPAKPKTYSRTGLVFQSLLFPGWGLTRVKKGPHWIKGLGAYGCVAGSIYYNRQAVDTYAQIDSFQDYEDKDDLYQKAMKQDNISEALAITAAGIWLVDFIWTLVGTSDLKTRHKNGPGSGLSLITIIDPFTYAPMLGVHISF